MGGQDDEAFHQSVLRTLYAELNDFAVPGQRQVAPAEMPGLRQWFDQALDVSAAGIDGLFFRFLAMRSQEPAIYLRERDLTYFGVEDWSPDQKIEYMKGVGEFPVLYKLDFSRPAAKLEARKVTLALLGLVEFMYRTAGSGLGISRKTPQGDERHDYRDIRRFRYRARLLGDVVWIERADGGRRTSAGGVQAAKPKGNPF